MIVVQEGRAQVSTSFHDILFSFMSLKKESLIKYFIIQHLDIGHIRSVDTRAHSTAYSKGNLFHFDYTRKQNNVNMRY